MENNKINSFMSPKPAMAFGVLVVVSLITSILTFMSSGAKGAEVGLGILFAVLIFSLILSSFALYLSTRLVKVPEGSFARAMFFSSGAILILGILASLLIMLGLAVPLVFLINIIILISLVRWYYKVSVMRSFGIFLINCVISGIMAFIFFIVMAALGFGLITALLFNGQQGMEKEIESKEVPITENSSLNENSQSESTMMDQINSSQTLSNNSSLNGGSPNPGTTLTAAQITQVKKMFPVGFPLPADSQIKFTKDQSLPDTYELEYTVSGNIKTILSTYESLFRKASYGYINAMPFDNDGVLVAQMEKHAVGNKDFRFDFLKKTPSLVEVKVSIHEWK
jgi:hypothetical protein